VNSSEHEPPVEVATAGHDVPLEKWQAIDGLWKAILVLEAQIESARLASNTLRGEMETAFKQVLNVEEKLHASQADVAQWNRAKSRLHFALPKVREFVHRATWALAAVERKRLEEVIHTHVEPRLPLPDIDHVREELEHLQKARQVLLAQGHSVHTECRALTGETQRVLSQLRRTAADNARKKKDAKRR
jgi:hypothetical protein